ncbi:DNA (cytosine-5-)-methyltransferase [Candidatus Nanosyncoccus nanoralicus]|uniref:Cytosine-specific methyltransferase n=1 Tax=Candidatus Nanosyncoccus nanoralicus TaxID=2171996 RepID=A0ABY0FLP7_9BACT|nr:DNA (cytosine-5-)-methyltransferase [Candidatus Nanosyncoccus nanoralicus]RYC73355.1 Modification methylase HhaI [Candidatus Nanosyncoccus nanoralicus]
MNGGKVTTFIDLFAGIGGFHFALHRQGAECVFSSEWDDECRKTYTDNFKKISPHIFELSSGKNTLFEEKLFAGDITKIDPKTIPDHDILCAGFPCQPFSISGKQRGFADTRGTLFFNVLEIVKTKQPKVVFLENVKQLVYHDHGNTLRVILQSLNDIGYKTSWKVLNAKDFGTAQNRERIIIIANKEKEFDFSKLETKQRTKIKSILDKTGNFEILDPKDYTILPKELWHEQDSGLIFCGYRNKKMRTVGVRPGTEYLSRVHKQPNRIYHINGTHPTLPSQETSGRFWIYDGKIVRKLTVDECYKLQGFPKSFKKNSKLSSCYKQIGNSVAIPMIEAVYKQIKEQYNL